MAVTPVGGTDKNTEAINRNDAARQARARREADEQVAANERKQIQAEQQAAAKRRQEEQRGENVDTSA